MHPHPAFREVVIQDREREIAAASRFAHFDRPERPARRSFTEWLMRRCPDVPKPRMREALDSRGAQI
jgi:hypothetical protein